MTRNLRAGARILRRSGGLSLSAVLTFALGIGATATVFSVLYGVLIRPLPYAEPDRLVRIWEEHPGGAPLVPERLNALTFDAWHDSTEIVEGMSVYEGREYTVTGLAEPERMEGASVSPSMFGLLGVAPAAGRFFREDEGIKPGSLRVILSHQLWQQRFAGRRDVIGTLLHLNGQPHEIIGVAPAWFYFPDRGARLWTPYVRSRGSETDPGQTVVMTVIARLRPGATIAQAEAQGTAMARSTTRPISAELMFGKGGPPQVRVRGLAASLTDRVRPAIVVVTAAVALVMLLACANVANLLLARGTARIRELAVCAALGAGRARLLRQALTEVLVLAVCGGTLAIVLAVAVLHALPAWAPADFPRFDDVRLDGRVLTFTFLVTLATGLLAGLLPALKASSARPEDALRTTGGRTTAGGGERLRALLLGVQSAIGVVLLIGAGLLGRSFVKLATVDPGFKPHNLLAARIHLSPVPADRLTARADAVKRLVERLESLPDVVAAGAGNMAPFGESSYMVGFQLPSKPDMARALYLVVTPGYEKALGLTMRQGRFLSKADVSSGTLAIVVNEAFVRTYLDDGRPVVGRHFRGLLGSDDSLAEIVGVAGDVLLEGLDGKPQPQMYVAHSDDRTIRREIYLFVRTAGSPSAVLPAIRSAVREVDAGAALADAGPFTAQVEASIAQPRFAAAVLIVIASLALVLAAVGLFGTVSYTVSRRRRELGIRAALGARPVDAIGLVLRHGLGVTAAGVAAGVLVALLASRALQPLLFGIASADVVSFLAAAAILLFVAAAGCFVPARRAARVDPAETLRAE